MSIPELAARSKVLLGRVPRTAPWLAIIALSASASFGLGILEGRDVAGNGIALSELATSSPSFLEASAAASATSPATTTIPAGGRSSRAKAGRSIISRGAGA